MGAADLGAADLGAADLGAADLGAADFVAADLGDVDFFDADFTADFTGVDFVCDEFAGTDLGSPDLADLVGFVKPLLGAFPAVAECAPGLAAVFFALGGLWRWHLSASSAQPPEGATSTRA